MQPFINIQKYLDRYAEPDAILTGRNICEKGLWDFAVAVPLSAEFDEVIALDRTLEQAAHHSNHRILIIYLINARENHPDNERLKDRWADTHRCLIDRATPGRFFGPKEGVGLARKIACDTALYLYSQGAVRSPILLTTDADARVPLDYFSVLERSADTERPATYLYGFVHDVGESDTALSLYEIWLRYYTLGLRFAGSHVAFHTLGSTLAIHSEAYAQVRGFPDLLAAEDFYILNKLANVGPVIELPALIHLTARESERVPFGTGVGSRKIQEQIDRSEPFRLYHPGTFLLLKKILLAFSEIEKRETAGEIRDHFLASLDKPLRAIGQNIFRERKIAETLAIAYKTRPRPSDRLRHIRTWFDAFQTLKWIHAARDAGLSDEARPEIDLNSLRRIDLAHYGILWDTHSTGTMINDGEVYTSQDLRAVSVLGDRFFT